SGPRRRPCRPGPFAARVVVLERQKAPVDKAWGEGLMPRGVRQLEALGVLPLLDATQCAPFSGIRYVQEDGAAADGLFRGRGGLGVRRTALVEAMAKRARAIGVEL